MFCSPNPSNIYGKKDFVSWKNIHFCGLKKETFGEISDGRKIQVNSFKKYVQLFSGGYYFPSYISPLSYWNKIFSWTVKENIFRGWKLKISFSQNQFSIKYTNFEEWKGTGKNRVQVDFFYSYSTVSPLQKICLHFS